MENVKDFLTKNNIKTGYVIESASGWYSSLYRDNENYNIKYGYTIFDTEIEAVMSLNKAINSEARSIKKIYYHE